MFAWHGAVLIVIDRSSHHMHTLVAQQPSEVRHLRVGHAFVLQSVRQKKRRRAAMAVVSGTGFAVETRRLAQIRRNRVYEKAAVARISPVQLEIVNT